MIRVRHSAVALLLALASASCGAPTADETGASDSRLIATSQVSAPPCGANDACASDRTCAVLMLPTGDEKRCVRTDAPCEELACAPDRTCIMTLSGTPTIFCSKVTTGT